MMRLELWLALPLALAVISTSASGLVVGSEGDRCEHVQLILHPASVVPAYSIGEGLPVPVVMPKGLGPDDAPQELCERVTRERTLSSNIMDFFIVAGDYGGCPLSQMQHVAASLGAVGMLLVRPDASVRVTRAEYAFDPESVPFAVVPERDWREMAQCKSENITFMVLNQEVLNMSLGLFFHWTMLRSVICWFALQAIICCAAVRTPSKRGRQMCTFGPGHQSEVVS